jgi:predicted kinase
VKILMLKGLPGSGKSTWAKQFIAANPNWVRVNKDSIRDMIAGYKRSKESLVLKFRDIFILNALIANQNVIVDDTNFHPKHEIRIRQLADIASGKGDPLYPVEVEIKIFDTPIEVCIHNDLSRQNSVGEKVIRKMHEDYIRPSLNRVIKNEKLPKAIICDLDGTLALHNGRNPYDASTCDEDLVNMPVADGNF